MNRSRALLVALAIPFLACRMSSGSPPADTSLSAFNAIIEAYERDHSAWVQKVSTEQDPERRAALIADRPDKEATVRQVMSLAEEAGRSEAGFMAWAWAYMESEEDGLRSRALSALLDSWAGRTEIMNVLPALERDEHERARATLNRLVDTHDVESVSLAASVALASWLIRFEPEQGENRAVELLERVVESHSDMPHPEGGTLTETATHRLFALRHLRIGATVPDISGEDLEGRSFKLSDYRGRAVLLTFWAHWCRGCMVQAGAERELVDLFRDQPFVMLGVNCDPGPTVSILAQNRKKDVTWRSFRNDSANHPFGSIARSWNVRTLPTTYLIGHDGTILQKWEATIVPRDRLLNAVEQAVEQAGSERRAIDSEDQLP